MSQSLNQNKKLAYLNKTLALHLRFMLLIKNNSVPKLHEIVKVAFSRQRGLAYIIDKIADAIDGIYVCRSSEDDKDLAFLIHQYGGPGLLDICHRALRLPSTSTAYRLLQASKKPIISSIDTLRNEFVNNIEVSVESPKYGYMLEIDENVHGC